MKDTNYSSYYQAERLDTGINPLPVGVASRNQRFTTAPTGIPYYRRGFLTSYGGLGGDFTATGSYVAVGILAVVFGYLALRR